MALQNNLLVIAATVLGSPVSDEDSDRYSDLFLTDKVGSDTYPESNFQKHMEAIATYGDGYLTFIDGLRSNVAMRPVYGFMVSQGPDAIYGLMESMGAAGLLDKKKVASAAKLPSKTGARAERAYFRQIWDELATVAYDAAKAKFTENADAYKAKFPEIDSESIVSLDDLLRVCGKSTLNAGVTKFVEPHTKHECSIALGWRLDIHSPKRNGGWDPKAKDGAGDFTKDYHEAQAKKSKSEDTSDEDSGDGDSNS